MKYFLSAILFLTLIFPTFAGEQPGFAQLKTAAEGGRPLELSIWYPAAEGNAQEIGGNAVFKGAEGSQDAAVKDGQFPLVILSHGGLRSAQNSGAWLAAALAQSGFIVAEINGPRPANAGAGVNEIWQRANDFSVALDGLLNDEKWAASIDRKAIEAVGYALGGTASLAVAGASFDVERFLRACDTQSGPDCGWYAAQNVTLDRVDQAQLAKSRFDARFSSAIAIVPEYMDVFAQDTVTGETPKLVLHLGEDGGADQGSDGLTTQETVVDEASIFDGFALCTAAGPKILEEDGGNSAICGQSQERRMKAHAAIADSINMFLSGHK
ncbi:alpha/beta hydrolase family protein [Ahrensia marina]|uniref:Dienelactone hydrolase n=1 Tax=Ahrensia marina TaxID=1514904 RepID=A0A0N0E749_9HYPH|nr:hypothetical protein [Ahrensia marina]KPB00765.1 hypothetical protein SU32_12185 [Ahrensia marina]